MCEDSLEAYIVEGWRTMLVYLERGVYFQNSLIGDVISSLEHFRKN